MKKIGARRMNFGLPTRSGLRTFALLALCCISAVRAQEVGPPRAVELPGSQPNRSMSPLLMKPAHPIGDLMSPVKVCRSLQRPRMPAHEGRLEARYEVKVQVVDGQAKAMEIMVLQAPENRRLNRALVTSIEDAIRAYDCPGTMNFIQSFHFRD